MGATEQVRGDILLGVLELSPVPICGYILARNFGVDEERMAEAFEELVNQGYVRRVGGGYYCLAPPGEKRVMTRSPAD